MTVFMAIHLIALGVAFVAIVLAAYWRGKRDGIRWCQREIQGDVMRHPYDRGMPGGGKQ